MLEKQHILKALPLELLFDIFKAIDTFPLQQKSKIVVIINILKMRLKKQHILKALPLELLFEIFRAINTFPLQQIKIMIKQTTSRKKCNYCSGYSIKILTSSKIIYICNREAFLGRKNFTYLPIKWNQPMCCQHSCLLQPNFTGRCITGNGFVRVVQCQCTCHCPMSSYPMSIYYKYSGNHINDKRIEIDANNYFPKIPGKMFYFEVGFNELRNDNNYKPNEAVIGLHNLDESFVVKLFLEKTEKYSFCYFDTFLGEIKLKDLSFDDGDVFGCALIMPPINSNKLPFIYFTKNGNMIGKAILLKNVEHVSEFVPFVGIKSCSIFRSNFGADLFNRPFLLKSLNFTNIEFYGETEWRSEVNTSDLDEEEIEEVE
ncbi:hypothetical protein ACQ4LE_003985 [Meloidogyne hapla]